MMNAGCARMIFLATAIAIRDSSAYILYASASAMSDNALMATVDSDAIGRRDDRAALGLGIKGGLIWLMRR